MSLVMLPIGMKASVPRLPEPWIRRPRLNDQCSKVSAGEVMLVAAFAGAGKTTLLADWFTHDCTIDNRIWLSLDSRDNAPGRLGNLLEHALGIAGGFDDLDGRNCSDLVVLDRIFEHVERRGERTVLVLDDVHEITSRHALAALSHLVLNLPPTLSVFLATRADPPLPLTRLQFEGRLHQIRTADLAMTDREAAALFEGHDLRLDADAVESLRARTGGWAGGLRLSALALAENSAPESFVENVVRADALISDYLVHEVLDSQPPEMRRFLLRTCGARVLTDELARELSGDPDADVRLAQLERSGVFLTQMCGTARTYQVHALFGQLLRARLRYEEPDLARSLLTRAAHWFLAHDMPSEAEYHAYEAGDLRLAGSLSCRRFVLDVLTGTWVSPGDLPVSVTDAAAVPELALIAAAKATAAFDRRRADLGRTRLDALLVNGGYGDEWFGVARLLLDVLYGRTFGTDARSLASCRALLGADLGSDTVALHTVTRLREAELLLDVDADDDETLRALLDARGRASRNAAHWVVDECDVLLALIAAVRGRLDSCDALLQGIPPRRCDDPVAGTRRLARALCEAQRGRINTARSELPPELTSSLVAHAVRVGTENAVRLLDVHSDATPDGAHQFASHVRIALGVIDGSDRTGAENMVADARGDLAKQRDEQVLARLEPLALERATQCQLRTRIEGLTLATIAADRLGDHARALASLQAALDLAAPADLRAPFLAHAGSLGVIIDRYSWQLDGASAYAVELVDDLQKCELPVYVEALTARELAVLEFLPTMMTNAEIAQQLLVSVNTVKTHLKSVYRKLGVDRRRDAVGRAKQLEIM